MKDGEVASGWSYAEWRHGCTQLCEQGAACVFTQVRVAGRMWVRFILYHSCAALRSRVISVRLTARPIGRGEGGLAGAGAVRIALAGARWLRSTGEQASPARTTAGGPGPRYRAGGVAVIGPLSAVGEAAKRVCISASAWRCTPTGG